MLKKILDKLAAKLLRSSSGGALGQRLRDKLRDIAYPDQRLSARVPQTRRVKKKKKPPTRR